MKRDYLLEMSGEDLDAYAQVLGVDTTKLKTAKAKVRLIEERRGRSVDIEVLGTTFTIPIKRLHDKNITDKLNSGRLTDEETNQLIIDLLGEEQTQALVERCTDDDGTVDIDAYGYAFAKIVRSEELKNF